MSLTPAQIRARVEQWALGPNTDAPLVLSFRTLDDGAAAQQIIAADTPGLVTTLRRDYKPALFTSGGVFVVTVEVSLQD